MPRETLKVLRDGGLRLLLVGYESGNQQILHNIKKGMRIEVAKRFTKDCHELGITIHGTFILGLPGETKETIEETIRFATEINPHTHPGVARRALSRHLPLQAGAGERLARQRQCRAGGRPRRADRAAALSRISAIPRSSTRSRPSTGSFYFRSGKIASIVGEMVRSPQMMKRRLREGVEFFQFLQGARSRSLAS